MGLLKISRASDIRQIALCHKSCFSKSFAAKLGYSYSCKTFEWFLEARNRFLFHIEQDGKVIAYCGGFQALYYGDGSTSGILQFAMKQALTGILKKPWLLFHSELLQHYPLILRNVYRKIFYARKKRSLIGLPEQHIESIQKIGLVVIGVHPAYRGKGHFEMLMRQFETECRMRHISKMTLSVRPGNERAIAAYKKVGWQIASQTEKGMDMFKLLSIK